MMGVVSSTMTTPRIQELTEWFDLCGNVLQSPDVNPLEYLSSSVLDGALHVHYQNTSYGNMIWKNDVNPSYITSQLFWWLVMSGCLTWMLCFFPYILYICKFCCWLYSCPIYSHLSVFVSHGWKKWRIKKSLHVRDIKKILRSTWCCTLLWQGH